MKLVKKLHCPIQKKRHRMFLKFISCFIVSHYYVMSEQFYVSEQLSSKILAVIKWGVIIIFYNNKFNGFLLDTCSIHCLHMIYQFGLTQLPSPPYDINNSIVLLEWLVSMVPLYKVIKYNLYKIHISGGSLLYCGV